ncbi:MAG: Crp/Fnr family transcriptional regulator [marine bacterium B5-7]|nr:MAG: Crp/Fnr family transcriptional regulator [marine bacterium B5-7]
MTTCLHTRLDSLNFLDEDDFALLDRLLERRDKATPGELVVVEMQKVTQTRLIIDGWAYRYRSLANGTRQILNFLIPGDIISFYAMMLPLSDCGVEAMTPMEFAHFPVTDLVETLSGSAHLVLALSWIAGQSERMLDEQITRIGRRNSKSRLAHILVELHVRLRNSGFDKDQACLLPLTQAVLSDALGMSAVHANRSFRALVKDGLIAREKSDIRLMDVTQLSRVADFDHAYLEQTEVPATTLNAIEPKLVPT